MRRTIVVLGILGLIGFWGFRALIGGQTVSWHQRLTVIVDTPVGEVRGASVVEITNTDTSGPLVLMEARGVHSEIRGEAVAVEVLPGRWLFALLSGGDNYKGDAGQLVYSAFNLGAGRVGIEQSYEANMADLRAQPMDTPVLMPPEAYPLLVTFDDITKPETVRELNPTDLAATFGPGVTLQGVTLELTKEAVTEGRVERVLRWLRTLWPNRLDGQRYGASETNNRLANSLASGSFSTEIKK